MLGAAWPVMQPEMAVPYSLAGIIQSLILAGTIVSTMFTGHLLKRLGTGRLTALSVGLTAGALLGFSFAPSFAWILAAAVPLGLGAGAVDTGLNVYVANHYKSRHMSWLHTSWGVGALGGPFILSMLLKHGLHWRIGYKSIGLFQVVLVIMLVAAIPLWARVGKRREVHQKKNQQHKSMLSALRIKGVPMALMVFLFYCGIETTMGLWGGSFLFKTKGAAPSNAAIWVSLFFTSLTAGRFLTGFLTMKLSNNILIFGGGLIVLSGVILMLLPLPLPCAYGSFLLIGFGCAPIFPCMIHETPVRFGSAASESIVGLQMAFGYIGATCLPPLFGFLASKSNMLLLPVFLLGYGLLILLGIFLIPKPPIREKN